MYIEKNTSPAFERFYLPFGGHIRGDNRWVQLADLIPWDEVEKRYRECFKKKKGRKAKSVRLALGALIIKEKMGSTDEELVETIRENPYLQYFLGFEGYKDERPFEASMMTYFRRRLGPDVIAEINEMIAIKYHASKKDIEKKKDQDIEDPPSGDSGSGNKGQLLLDATCAPQDMRHPSDVILLSEARETTEKIIDSLHVACGEVVKPRTYRKKARKQYLSFMRGRRRTKQEIRKALRQQLGYLKRNLATIEPMIARVSSDALRERQKKDLLIIQEVYRQQKYLFDHDTHSIPEKILSVSQPHVRAIARGKARGAYEFGAKLSASVTEDRMVFVDRLSWEPYNESEDFIPQVEKYRERFGHYPASVHADKIYRTRGNLQYCKENKIRLSGPKLGRPFVDTENNKAKIRELKRIVAKDEAIRQEIESVFGVGKRRYGLDRIMARTKITSESMIMVSVLVMNLATILRDLSLYFSECMWEPVIFAILKRVQKIFLRFTEGSFQNPLNLGVIRL